MFDTGRRTIFDVSVEHIGHAIEILPIEREGLTVGIKYYCRTCSQTLLQQETENYQVHEETVDRKARRLGAKPFEQWQEDFDRECFEADGEYAGYECSEWASEYARYVDSFERQPERQGWDSQSTGCVGDTAWDTNDREWTT